MLYEVMKQVRNFFPTGTHVYETFKIEDGTVQLPFLQDGQYFLIEKSVFNDGVHKYPASDLKDETFYGCISPLAIPKDFLRLVEDIEKWQEKNADIVASPYLSESFGGYSYTKATSASTEGAVTSWQGYFKSRLAEWRKI